MQKYTVEIDNSGTIRWYKFGTSILHREDGPALEWATGTKFWYKEDKLHREDGPAIKQVFVPTSPLVSAPRTTPAVTGSIPATRRVIASSVKSASVPPAVIRPAFRRTPVAITRRQTPRVLTRQP